MIVESHRAVAMLMEIDVDLGYAGSSGFGKLDFGYRLCYGSRTALEGLQHRGTTTFGLQVFEVVVYSIPPLCERRLIWPGYNNLLLTRMP